MPFSIKYYIQHHSIEGELIFEFYIIFCNVSNMALFVLVQFISKALSFHHTHFDEVSSHSLNLSLTTAYAGIIPLCEILSITACRGTVIQKYNIVVMHTVAVYYIHTCWNCTKIVRLSVNIALRHWHCIKSDLYQLSLAYVHDIRHKVCRLKQISTVHRMCVLSIDIHT